MARGPGDVEWPQPSGPAQRVRASPRQRGVNAARAAGPEDWHRARSASPRDPLRSPAGPESREPRRNLRCHQNSRLPRHPYFPGEDRYSSARRHFPVAAEPLQARAKATPDGPEQSRCRARPRSNRSPVRTAHERRSAPRAAGGGERHSRCLVDGGSRRPANECRPLDCPVRQRKAKPLSWRGWHRARPAVVVRARHLSRQRRRDNRQLGRPHRAPAQPLQPRQPKPPGRDGLLLGEGKVVAPRVRSGWEAHPSVPAARGKRS